MQNGFPSAVNFDIGYRFKIWDFCTFRLGKNANFNSRSTCFPPQRNDNDIYPTIFRHLLGGFGRQTAEIFLVQELQKSYIIKRVCFLTYFSLRFQHVYCMNIMLSLSFSAPGHGSGYTYSPKLYKRVIRLYADVTSFSLFLHLFYWPVNGKSCRLFIFPSAHVSQFNKTCKYYLYERRK